jgi:hypothetical protein
MTTISHGIIYNSDGTVKMIHDLVGHIFKSKITDDQKQLRERKRKIDKKRIKAIIQFNIEETKEEIKIEVKKETPHEIRCREWNKAFDKIFIQSVSSNQERTNKEFHNAYGCDPSYLDSMCRSCQDSIKN